MRSTRLGRIIETAAEAEACFVAMAATRQSIFAYSKRHGICRKSLYRWRDRLGIEPDWSAPPGGAAIGRARRAPEVASPQFVELIPAAGATPPPQPAPPARYEVSVGPVRVVVGDDFRDDTLTRLLRVVASCSA